MVNYGRSLIDSFDSMLLYKQSVVVLRQSIYVEFIEIYIFHGTGSNYLYIWLWWPRKSTLYWWLICMSLVCWCSLEIHLSNDYVDGMCLHVCICMKFRIVEEHKMTHRGEKPYYDFMLYIMIKEVINNCQSWDPEVQ